MVGGATAILSQVPEDLSKEEAHHGIFHVNEQGLMHSLSTVLSHEMVCLRPLSPDAMDISFLCFIMCALSACVNGVVVAVTTPKELEPRCR